MVDLERAYDREEPLYCIRKSGVAEKHVRVEQDMNRDYEAVRQCAVGATRVQGEGGTASGISSETLLVCFGDG